MSVTTGPVPVARRGAIDLVVAAAGLLSVSMGLGHFCLPYIFRWGDVLTRTPALKWGLFMLNASFSYLLLAGGVLTLVIAARGGARDGMSRLVLGTVGGYWLFNAAWQIIAPLPMPPGMEAMKWGFLGFSVTATLLYAAGLARSAAPARAAGPQRGAR